MYMADFSTNSTKRLTKFLCEYYWFEKRNWFVEMEYKFGRYDLILDKCVTVSYYVTPKTLEEAQRRHAGHNFYQVIIDNYTSKNKIHRYLKFRERPTYESKRYERSEEART